MKFTKPATDIDAQIALLRSRGLTIPDDARARHYLRFMGYYRLSGYALAFQVNYNQDGLHRFHPNANFDDILDLYIFDRKLRLLVLDALERIEVAARSTLSHEMSLRYGAHWFMDAAHFVPNYDYAHFVAHIKQTDCIYPYLFSTSRYMAKIFSLAGEMFMIFRLLKRDFCVSRS